MVGYYRITKIEMPKAGEWGVVQINDFSNTFFRFDMVDGKPKLDTSFFADQVEDPNDKHRHLSSDSDLYKGIQQALAEHVAACKENKYVVRGRTMKFTSCSPDNFEEEVTYDTYDKAKIAKEQLKITFPFEEFEVKEV